MLISILLNYTQTERITLIDAQNFNEYNRSLENDINPINFKGMLQLAINLQIVVTGAETVLVDLHSCIREEIIFRKILKCLPSI